MPCQSAVFAWIHADEEFAKNYARATELRTEAMAEEILSIADDGRNDTYEDSEGNEKVDNDVIQRSRLRVDTRKWLMSKLKPKKYGERPDEVNVSTIVHNHVPVERQREWQRRHKEALARK